MEKGNWELGIGNWELEIGNWELGNEINYLNKATTSAGGIALPISRVATTRPVGKWKWLSLEPLEPSQLPWL